MQAAGIHCGVCAQTADNDLPLLKEGGGKYLIDAPNSFDRAVLNQRYIFTPPSLPKGAFKAAASFYPDALHATTACCVEQQQPSETDICSVCGWSDALDGLFPEPT